MRTSALVPWGTLMVGPGKMPLYPATVVSSPGTMFARPNLSVSRYLTNGPALSTPWADGSSTGGRRNRFTKGTGVFLGASWLATAATFSPRPPTRNPEPPTATAPLSRLRLVTSRSDMELLTHLSDSRPAECHLCAALARITDAVPAGHARKSSSAAVMPPITLNAAGP